MLTSSKLAIIVYKNKNDIQYSTDCFIDQFSSVNLVS